MTDETLLRDLLEAGARGYVLKSDAGQHLIAAIQSLADHRPFLTGRALELLLENFLAKVQRIRRPLTDREQSIVQLIAEGHSNQQAADVLNLSIKTVEIAPGLGHA